MKPGDAKLKLNSKRSKKVSGMDMLRFRFYPEIISCSSVIISDIITMHTIPHTALHNEALMYHG